MAKAEYREIMVCSFCGNTTWRCFECKKAFKEKQEIFHIDNNKHYCMECINK